MGQTSQTSRLNFLRGAGVALALPWLESLPVYARDDKPAANKPPLRFAHIYFSNGVEPIHWWAKGGGAAIEFGQAAQPLAPIREDLIFLRGLYHQKAFTSTSPHLGRMNLLSGATVSLDLYNLFNVNPVRAYSAAYASWQRPQGILPPRFAKFVVQLDF